MKKLYLLFLLISFGGFAQHITITKIIETDCSSPFVKTVELYVDGTVDFSDFGPDMTQNTADDVVILNYMLNGAPWADNQIDISALGTVTDSFVYIVRDMTLMQTEFPSTTFDASNTVVVGTSTNGDDGYQIVLNGTVVSQFGKTETDADDDTIWEHDDSVVSRKSGIEDLGTWDETHWDYSGKDSIDDETACQGGSGAEAFLAALGGTYPLGSGSGWTPSGPVCTVVFGNVSSSCDTTQEGATDDTYTATVDYIGGDTGKTFVLGVNVGAISGDDPTNVAAGTITITNIPEGTDVTLSVSDLADGGVCDLSQMIDSPSCIPFIINEVLFDPANDDAGTTGVVEGDANGDGTRDSSDDEFIEFINNSNSALDVSGYTISDAAELRHTFPASTIIPANSMIVVFGGGIPTGGFGGSIVQVASEGALNLNNAGDVITVRNTANDIVVIYDSSSTGISHGSNQSVTRSPDITGSFVLHSDANAALMFSPGLLADGSTLSVSQLETNNFSIYPNPVTNNYLNIKSVNSSPINVSILNMLGKQIINNVTLINNKLNISELNSGLYILKISQDNTTISKKLIVE